MAVTCDVRVRHVQGLKQHFHSTEKKVRCILHLSESYCRFYLARALCDCKTLRVTGTHISDRDHISTGCVVARVTHAAHQQLKVVLQCNSCRVGTSPFYPII